MRLVLLASALLALSASVSAGAGDDGTCSSSQTVESPLPQTSAAEQKRDRALERAALGDRDAEGPLLEALAEAGDGDERRRIVRLLGQIGSERSLPALLDLLAERRMTGEAQAALLRIDPQWRRRPEVEPVVARLAASLSVLPDPMVKPAVCASPPSFDVHGDPEETEAGDEDEDDAAVSASDFFEKDPCQKAEWAEQEMCWTREARISLLASFDRSRAADAAELLFDAGRCLEDGVVGLLAEEGRFNVATALDDLLAGSVPDLSVTGVERALDKAEPGWRDGPDGQRAARTLTARLDSDSAEDRERALQLLADLRLRAGAPALLRILDDASRSQSERALAARALGAERVSAREAQVRCAETAPTPVRLACSDVLISAGATEGRRALRGLLVSQDADVRRRALAKLTELGVDRQRTPGPGASSGGGGDTVLDAETRATALRVCLELALAGGDERHWALSILEHLANPEMLSQARELFARRGDLDYGRDSVIVILLEAGGPDELQTLIDSAREDPELVPDLAEALTKLEWAPASAFDELLDLLRARGATATPRVGDQPIVDADWKTASALDAVARRLTASPEQASVENLRWLAHHHEPHIRALARYALFRAGISLEASQR